MARALGAATAAILEDSRPTPSAADPWSPWLAADGWESATAAAVTVRLATPSGSVRQVSVGNGTIVVDAETIRGEISPAGENRWRVCLNGTVRSFETRTAGASVFVGDGQTGYVLERLPPYADDRSHAEADHHPGAPMPGSVVKVHVAAGDQVAAVFAWSGIDFRGRRPAHVGLQPIRPDKRLRRTSAPVIRR